VGVSGFQLVFGVFGTEASVMDVTVGAGSVDTVFSTTGAGGISSFAITTGATQLANIARQ
jgi:hypothetical protein